VNDARPLSEDECEVIDSCLLAREEQGIPTTHLEDIKSIQFIIRRFWGGQDTYNNIPLFRKEVDMSCPKHQAQEEEIRKQYGLDNPPPGSTLLSESQYTMSARMDALQATEDLPPDPIELQDGDIKDEVGSFDIGKSIPIADVKAELGLDDKGPGFEERLKNMEGKAPMSLLSPIFIEGICEVLAYGSEKYAPNMWRDDPMTFTAELDSIFRHLFAFLRCEDYDAAPPSGSGLLHLFNAACRLMFLTERYFTHPELDDRYPAPGLNDEMFQKEVHEGAEAQYEDKSDEGVYRDCSCRAPCCQWCGHFVNVEEEQNV